MAPPTDQQLNSALLAILADAFNRSINALEGAGAVDAARLRSDYKPGSKYYDLVSEQLEYTAKFGVGTIRDLFRSASSGTPSIDA
jgi:hypothetical protein